MVRLYTLAGKLEWCHSNCWEHYWVCLWVPTPGWQLRVAKTVQQAWRSPAPHCFPQWSYSKGLCLSSQTGSILPPSAWHMPGARTWSIWVQQILLNREIYFSHRVRSCGRVKSQGLWFISDLRSVLTFPSGKVGGCIYSDAEYFFLNSLIIFTVIVWKWIAFSLPSLKEVTECHLIFPW